MAVTINWIPVEERLPDVSVHEHENVTYVTFEDLVTSNRFVADNVGFDWWSDRFTWVEYDDNNYRCYWHPFEDENCRVVAWSKDTVDILPY